MTQPSAVLSLVRLSKPQFRSNEDKLAFAVHAYVTAQGYKLVATGQDAEAVETDFDMDREEVSTTGWDGLCGAYAFRYQDVDGKRPAIFIKCLAIGPNLLVQWMTSSSGDAPHEASVVEIPTAKFTTDENTAPQAYQNTQELMDLLDSSLGRALGVAHSGGKNTTAASTGAATEGAAEQAAAAQRRHDQQQEREGERAGPSYFPYEEGHMGEGRLPPGMPPTGVGFDDVVPPGFQPPGYHPGPGSLMEGPPRRGGGMMVGPDHPIFGTGKLGEGVGVGRGQGMPGMPPGGVRWDPIGPPGTRGFRPDDFQRDPSKPHPDMMQPGPGKGTDWDSFYG